MPFESRTWSVFSISCDFNTLDAVCTHFALHMLTFQISFWIHILRTVTQILSLFVHIIFFFKLHFEKKKMITYEIQELCLKNHWISTKLVCIHLNAFFSLFVFIWMHFQLVSIHLNAFFSLFVFIWMHFQLVCIHLNAFSACLYSSECIFSLFVFIWMHFQLVCIHLNAI